MRTAAAHVDSLLRVGELPCSGMEVCAVCGGALPPVSIRNRDPFCSRVCAQTHHGTGDPAERARASRAQLEKAMEEGTDAASLELRRVTVDERSKLIAEGRYGEEFLRAFQAYLIAHKSPVTEATVTWFSYRSSGPTMRRHEEPEEDDPWSWRNRERTESGA
jgi:hypothetical protein